ncbi:hypothetical protein B0H11DRAFT_2247021 [Mycena galericulata]|nr:hypothetical protein B0H11DRAFT_2247021 [Mycena galericulata]
MCHRAALHPSRLFPGFRAYPPNPSKQIRTWLAHVVPPRRSVRPFHILLSQPAANDFLVRSRPSRLSPAARAHPYNPFSDAEEYIDDGANEMSADEDEAPDDDDEESNAPYSVYIDDRAIEVSGDEDEVPDDDEDSTEAQIRCADERDFQMREIVGTHDQRLRSQEPYRIPPRLLQASGAATPARGDDDDELENAGVRSRSPTPLATWTAPQQPLSRAATPYVPRRPRHYEFPGTHTDALH